MHAGIRTLWAAVAAALLLAVTPRPAAAEDNKAEGSVDGTVVYRGKPLPGGLVGFHPAKGKPVFAKIQADGTYSTPAVPVGEVKVTVDTRPAKPKPGDGKAAKYIPIPQKYATPETSGLKFTVQKGKQTLDIKLE